MVVVVTFGSPISLKSFSDNSRMRSRVRRGGLASMSSGPGEPGQRHALAFQTASRAGHRFVEVSDDYEPVVRTNFRGFIKDPRSRLEERPRPMPEQGSDNQAVGHHANEQRDHDSGTAEVLRALRQLMTFQRNPVDSGLHARIQQ